MRATFENTVSILVKAYLNGELEHGQCKKCAVGNIVKGYTPDLYHQDGGAWFDLIMNKVGLGTKVSQLALEQIKATGYTKEEIILIENAFESADEDCDIDGYYDDTYEGLMAVVDVLADIHGINLEAKESAKQLFVKA